MKAKKKASRTWRAWAVLPKGFASIHDLALNGEEIGLIATRDGARWCQPWGGQSRLVRLEITERAPDKLRGGSDAD